MNTWQQFKLFRGQMMILFCFLVRFAVFLNIACCGATRIWRYKSQTYKGPNGILWQLLVGVMPVPIEDCLNDKQINCLVHFYKRCVSGFRWFNICSFSSQVNEDHLSLIVLGAGRFWVWCVLWVVYQKCSDRWPPGNTWCCRHILFCQNGRYFCIITCAPRL